MGPYERPQSIPTMKIGTVSRKAATMSHRHTRFRRIRRSLLLTGTNPKATRTQTNAYFPLPRCTNSSITERAAYDVDQSSASIAPSSTE